MTLTSHVVGNLGQGPTVSFFLILYQWRIQDFPNGGVLFCRKWGGAHPVFR